MCRLWRILMHPRVHVTVEPILLAFMFAQFLSYPVYQKLVYNMVCDRTPGCNLTSNSSNSSSSSSNSNNNNNNNNYTHYYNISSSSSSNYTHYYSSNNGKTHYYSNNNSSNSSSNNGKPSGCKVPSDMEQRIQRETSHWILYTNLALGLPTICFSLLYGSISDRLGRKLFIFLPALGAALNSGVLLEVSYLRDQLPLYLCLIGAFFSGIYGSYPVLNFAAYAYAADVTAKSGRTRQIGLLESMTYLGATLSLLVGGAWMSGGGDSAFVQIFWCILACQVAVMAYTIFCLPESLYFSSSSSSPGQRLGGWAAAEGDEACRQQPRSTYNRKFSRRHKLSKACGRFFAGVGRSVCGFFKLLATDWRLSMLMTVFFVVEINFLGITDVVFLYAMGEPLCWGIHLVGYFLALKVFCNGVGSLFLLPVLLFFGFSDAAIVMLGLVSGGVSLVMMGVATKTWVMFLVPVVSALRGCVVPTLRSMLSKQVTSDKQGLLFSSLGVLESVCMLLASVIYNSTYPITRTIHHGFSFFMMAAALLLPLLLIMFLYLYSNGCHCIKKLSFKKSEFPIERERLLQ